MVDTGTSWAIFLLAAITVLLLVSLIVVGAFLEEILDELKEQTAIMRTEIDDDQ